MQQKTLVAYFSASGITARAAASLAGAIGADLYEIKPAVPYTPQDLNWLDKRSRSTLEMKDEKARPALADSQADLAGFDTIFLGFPIWWYTAPRIIQTFLESRDFSGKTIIPFATSGGSGMGTICQHLAPSCPGATVKTGGLLNGSFTPEALQAWAAGVR